MRQISTSATVCHVKMEVKADLRYLILCKLIYRHNVYLINLIYVSFGKNLFMGGGGYWNRRG